LTGPKPGKRQSFHDVLQWLLDSGEISVVLNGFRPETRFAYLKMIVMPVCTGPMTGGVVLWKYFLWEKTLHLLQYA